MRRYVAVGCMALLLMGAATMVRAQGTGSQAIRDYSDMGEQELAAQDLKRAVELNPNLAVVGRCISATHEALTSVRLQSHCMVMGQGVGTCAALAFSAGVEMAKFDIRKLQAQLRKDGVYLEDVPS